MKVAPAMSLPALPSPRPRVLLLERQDSLRRALGDLLRRRGLEVTDAAPEGYDLFSRTSSWDVVVFNAAQRPIRRRRWLFGYRPALGQTRLVALFGAPASDSLASGAPASDSSAGDSSAAGSLTSTSSTTGSASRSHSEPSVSPTSSQDRPAFDRNEVDALVPYPVSMSVLVNAILGSDPRLSPRPRPSRPSRPRNLFREADTDPGFRRRS